MAFKLLQRRKNMAMMSEEEIRKELEDNEKELKAIDYSIVNPCIYEEAKGRIKTKILALKQVLGDRV